jgi:hypothetical protein
MKIDRDPAGKTFNMDASTTNPIDGIALRIGPFPADTRSACVMVNGRCEKIALQRSGDSNWAWLDLGDGNSRSFTVRAVAE